MRSLSLEFALRGSCLPSQITAVKGGRQCRSQNRNQNRSRRLSLASTGSQISRSTPTIQDCSTGARSSWRWWFRLRRRMVTLLLENSRACWRSRASSVENLVMRAQRLEEIEWEIANLARAYQRALLIGPESHPRTWQLMHTMSDLALIPVMHFKKGFARARPEPARPEDRAADRGPRAPGVPERPRDPELSHRARPERDHRRRRRADRPGLRDRPPGRREPRMGR